MDLSAGNHRLSVQVGGERRHFRLHVPKLRRDRPPIITFDGVTLCNPEGSMGKINGVDAASDKFGFVAIHPVAKMRYLGYVAGWNTPGGYLSARRKYDDVDFVTEILRTLGIEKVYAVGFSAGAQFAHILAGRLPGAIIGVVSVSGTWLGTEPSPAPGTAAWIVHGQNDCVLPYNGGAGSMKTKILGWLGNRNVWLSMPSAQIEAYRAANGYSSKPVQEVWEMVTFRLSARGSGENGSENGSWQIVRRMRRSGREGDVAGCDVVSTSKIYSRCSYGPPGGVPVEEYRVHKPYGGHTYHGRNTGEGTESTLSKGHGRPLPPEIFSVNDDILGRLEERTAPPPATVGQAT